MYDDSQYTPTQASMLCVLLEAWSMLLAAASTIAPPVPPRLGSRRCERQQSTSCTYEMDAFRCVGQSPEQLAAPPRRRNPHALPPPYGVSTCVDGARLLCLHVCDALPPARQTHMHQDPPTSAVPFQPRPCASNSSPLPLLACCACTARAPSVDLTSHRVRSHARGHRRTETPPSPALSAPTCPVCTHLSVQWTSLHQGVSYRSRAHAGRGFFSGRRCAWPSRLQRP